MNTTGSIGEVDSRESLRRILPERIEHLDEEAMEDFVQLIELYQSSRDPEVMETIVELLSPDDDGGIVANPGVSREGKRKLAEYQQKIGAKIRLLRMERQWSQQQLAEHAQLKQSHVSRLEKGIHTPTDLTIKRLADAFGVEASELDPSLE